VGPLTARGPLERVGLAAGGVAAAAMVATPLCPRRSQTRAALATVTVTGLFGATLAATARRWGTRPALAAAGSVVAATVVAEKLGTTTGVPFGRYRYTGRLQPTIGGVPVIVALAWFAMGVPSREVGRRRWWAGALALTAWDLFLDPQMTAEGYWRWQGPGRFAYRGIPVSNYLGWLVTGAGIMVLLDRLLPAGPDPAATTPDRPLVAVYTWMAVMQTLGFLVFFGDPLVAVVGGAGMLPFVVAAWRRH
jgi:putative membrane protein